MSEPRILRIVNSNELAGWDIVLYTIGNETPPKIRLWMVDGFIHDALAGLTRFNYEWNSGSYDEYKDAASRTSIDDGVANNVGFKSVKHMYAELLGGE